MFVSVISFVLVLSVLVSRVSATENKNVALKDQLARSLTHVSDMLVDMEHKIEQERKQLSQIDSNLSHKEPQIFTRAGDKLLFHQDYDDVLDIWWTTANSNGHQMDGKAVTAATVTPGKYGNVMITIKTTPTFTRPSNWILTTRSVSAFVADMKHNMVLNHHGYFTTFAERFMELIYTKNETEAYPVVHHVAVLLTRNAVKGMFKNLGVDLLSGIGVKLIWFQSLPFFQLKEQAGVLHSTLKLMDKSMSVNLKSLWRFYDTMFTKEEGEELFESLEAFYVYPKENKTFESIGERIFDAMLAPYIKSEGNRKQKRFVQLMLMAAHDLDPNFRAQTMPSLNNSDTDANHSTRDHNQSPFPERRSMNYKKIIKHFLVKHPKLFRKLKRQYKHDKKNEHHRFSHTQKRHNNYRKSRGRHQKRESLYNREQTRQRSYTRSSYELENEENEAESSQSGAYYRENSKAFQQKNIHKVQRAQKSEIRFDKLKQHTQKQHNAKQKQWNILKGTRSTTKPYQNDPLYLKQLAIQFLRNKQQRQNFYRNRRFSIPSSEEEICNHSQNLQDSIENDILHKIREASSYSDQEDPLRNNLYDALRHGNRTFVSFRKSDGGINNKQTLRAISERKLETDEEWVLKNNIYKVFEQDKK